MKNRTGLCCNSAVSLHLATVLIHGTHAFQNYKVVLINKTKTAQQLIGNGRGSIGLIGTIA